MPPTDPYSHDQAHHAETANRDDLTEWSLFSLATLFDSLPEAVVVADRERRVRYVNTAAVTLFGYSLQDLQGRKTEFCMRTRPTS